MYWVVTFPERLTFNSLSSGILKPGLWKNTFEDRRCIVPADSFFERKRLHKKNNPKYEISVPGRERSRSLEYGAFGRTNPAIPYPLCR